MKRDRNGMCPDAIDRLRESGDPACWLHLICDSCGAVISERDGHRPGCEAEPARSCGRVELPLTGYREDGTTSS